MHSCTIITPYKLQGYLDAVCEESQHARLHTMQIMDLVILILTEVSEVSVYWNTCLSILILHQLYPHHREQQT